MTKGWFETDEDYSDRMRQESAEKIIEQTTGSPPSKGWLESDEDYRSRVTQEANENVIEESTGSAPSKGWFESDSDYRTRVFEEANAKTVEDATGSSPQKGWFESDDEYRSRIFREANEAVVEGHAGAAPRQGFFESESNYKKRVSLEAREFRAKAERENSRTGYASDMSADTGSASSVSPSAERSGIGIAVILVLLAIVFFAGRDRGSSQRPANPPQLSVATTASPGAPMLIGIDLLRDQSINVSTGRISQPYGDFVLMGWRDRETGAEDRRMNLRSEGGPPDAVDSARSVVMGQTEPGYAGCSAAAFSDDVIGISAMAPGTWFCLKGTNGRLVEMRLNRIIGDQDGINVSIVALF
jgi:hypothetical protein